MKESVLLTTEFPDIKLFKRGKVRDLYDLEDKLLIVATDRISAFDVVLPNGIPYKGKVLTALSKFWFNFTKNIVPNHLISTKIESFPLKLKKYENILKERAMLVKKTKPIRVECVVRGYLAGSAWKEYREKGSVCGINLPTGLRESERLSQPIFSPATKATSGHDINITQNQLQEMVGKGVSEELKTKSLALYEAAREYAESKGIIIADTKFEFGVDKDKIILIDELLTPDSSRFWPKENYQIGKAQESFDKQYLRDYLEKLNWDKTFPAPSLPPKVIKKVSEKYLGAYKKIVGKKKKGTGYFFSEKK